MGSSSPTRDQTQGGSIDSSRVLASGPPGEPLSLFLYLNRVLPLTVKTLSFLPPPASNTQPHCSVPPGRVYEVASSCLTLCDPMNCGPPGSSVHGIFQARILVRVAISFCRESSQARDLTSVSCKSPALQADSLSLSHWGSPFYFVTMTKTDIYQSIG